MPALCAPWTKKGAPPKRGNLGTDGSHRTEGLAYGPVTRGETCAILVAKRQIVGKVPVRFRTNRLWSNQRPSRSFHQLTGVWFDIQALPPIGREPNCLAR
ncbi:hypothetical protein GFM44_37175 [Rhizobium leguminosarum bv. viciae]|nr:hypothetical protein [Rhizobium leguminosarum bv. viciae]